MLLNGAEELARSDSLRLTWDRKLVKGSAVSGSAFGDAIVWATAAGTTNAPAGAATAIGAAYDATVSISGSAFAQVAAGTGTALNATISTTQGSDPTIEGGGGLAKWVAVNAVNLSIRRWPYEQIIAWVLRPEDPYATGALIPDYDLLFDGGRSHTVPVSITSRIRWPYEQNIQRRPTMDASAAAGGTNAPAEAATGTGTAFNAAAAVSPTAGISSSNGTAYNASVNVAPNAGVSTSNGTAYNASVNIGASAGAVTGTGTAANAAVAVSPTAGVSLSNGAAYNASINVAPSAGAVAGTGAAANAATAVSPTAGLASGVGAAYDATVTVSGFVNAAAEVATGVGAAQQPIVAQPPSPGPTPYARVRTIMYAQHRWPVPITISGWQVASVLSTPGKRGRDEEVLAMLGAL